MREDIALLMKVREAAPYTWRCSSFYYEIAEKWGVPLTAEDSERDAVVDKMLELE